MANEEDASREAGHIIRATTKYREYSLFGQGCDIMGVIANRQIQDNIRINLTPPDLLFKKEEEFPLFYKERVRVS